MYRARHGGERVGAMALALLLAGCSSEPVQEAWPRPDKVTVLPEQPHFPKHEREQTVKSVPLPESFWDPVLGRKERSPVPPRPAVAPAPAPAAAVAPRERGLSAPPPAAAMAPPPAETPVEKPAPPLPMEPPAVQTPVAQPVEKPPGPPDPEPVAPLVAEPAAEKPPPEPVAAPPRGLEDEPVEKPAGGSDPEPVAAPAETPEVAAIPAGEDTKPSSRPPSPPPSRTAPPAGTSASEEGRPALPGAPAPVEAGEAEPTVAAAKRTAFPLLLPAAAALPLVALLLLWLVSRRRHRFRVELQRLFGMPWKGHLPASQLRAFVLAHRALHERLEGVHGVLETVRTRSGEDDDEEAQQLDRLVRAIDQRRQHILTDVQRLASGRKGSETTLERALRIHAARMSLLDALDDLVQGLAEIHGRSRV